VAHTIQRHLNQMLKRQKIAARNVAPNSLLPNRKYGHLKAKQPMSAVYALTGGTNQKLNPSFFCYVSISAKRVKHVEHYSIIVLNKSIKKVEGYPGVHATGVRFRGTERLADDLGDHDLIEFRDIDKLAIERHRNDWVVHDLAGDLGIELNGSSLYLIGSKAKT